ncbi:MAG: hypothetical protein ABSH12_01040 [Endomicrobiales bacterium]|jgi:hypothetical protein
MKTFGLKKLLPIVIPIFLTLSAAIPKITAQSLFGALQEGQPVLVYSFVWVPILEVSMMIAQYILPTKETTSPKSDCNTKTNNKQTASSTDYSLNTLVSRELMVLKQVKLDVTTLDIALPATALHLPLPCASRSSQSPGILLTVSLIFLFLPLLPRSDIPL